MSPPSRVEPRQTVTQPAREPGPVEAAKHPSRVHRAMRSAMRLAHSVRLAAILALGAFGLHQLRYLIAGLISSPEVAQAGHRYMADLLPPIAVLVLAAAVATLIRGTEGASPSRAPLGRRIVVFAAALLAIYVGQEFLEGLIGAGHPAGPAALLATGGWLALPLALAHRRPVGAARERCSRGSSARSRSSTRSGCSRARPRSAAGPSRLVDFACSSSPLAFGLARRPPPLTFA